MTTEPRRRITIERFEQLEAKVDEALTILRRLDATPVAPMGPVHDAQRGTFLSGTGWLKDASEQQRTPEALAALEQLRKRDEP